MIWDLSLQIVPVVRAVPLSEFSGLDHQSLPYTGFAEGNTDLGSLFLKGIEKTCFFWPYPPAILGRLGKLSGREGNLKW